jgi:hypothetical protein
MISSILSFGLPLQQSHETRITIFRSLFGVGVALNVKSTMLRQ